MDEVIIPPAPNWYKSTIFTCTPDNTLIYAARNYIITIVPPCDKYTKPNVKILSETYSKFIISLDFNRKWNEFNKIIVTASDDCISLWDLNESKKIKSLNEVFPKNEEIISVAFGGNDRIVGITLTGTILIWNIGTNETKLLEKLLDHKINVSCLSICPFVSWLAAVGFSNGCIVVLDLRRNGTVYYKLRGHTKCVTSLSWCPAPINIFPKKPYNIVINKKKTELNQSNDNSLINSDETENSIDGNSEIFVEEKYVNEITDKSTTNEPSLKNCEINKFNEEIDVSNESDENKLKNEDEPIKDENEDSLNEKTKEITARIIEEEEPRKEYLLASSAQDKYVYIWRAGTDGRLENFFSVFKQKARNFTEKWIYLSWMSPNNLLITQSGGHLIQCTLPKPANVSSPIKVIEKNLGSLIYVTGPITYKNEYDWNDKTPLIYWTFSTNGLLMNKNLETNEIIMEYTTFSTSGTSLKVSTLDPNQLAIGFTDGYIKLWKASDCGTNSIVMNILLHKYNMKISSLAWHPTQENVLAFGSVGGHVGYYSNNKNIQMLKYYFHDVVHVVEWGPLSGNINNLGIFVVSEGKVGMYDIKNGELEILRTTEFSDYIYRISWKPDFSCLLLSSKDGDLSVLSTDLNELKTIHFTEKGTTRLLWHPDAKNNDLTLYPYCNRLAACTNKKLIVYDCTLENENEIKIDIIEDKKQIIDIYWSPYDSNQLAFATTNGMFYIWDVDTKKIISSHIENNFSEYSFIVWSPIDPDYIIIGDKYIKIWKISENPPDSEAKMIENNTKIINKLTKKNKKKSNKTIIIPTLHININEKNDLNVPLLRKIFNMVENDFDDDNLKGALALFGTKDNLLSSLNNQCNILKKSHQYKTNDLLLLWKGDISTAVKDAINENRVTPLIITLAPMVSPQLWQKACELYAIYLSEQSNSDPIETAMYFLASNKIQDAIDHLLVTLRFSDALALAKSRLPEGDPLIADIIEKWALYCSQNGNYGMSIVCYIVLKNYKDAIKVFCRRNNSIEEIQFILELIEKLPDDYYKDNFRFDFVETLTNLMNGKLEKTVKESRILEKEEDTTKLQPTVEEKSIENDN